MIIVLVPSYLVVFGNTPILVVSPALSGNSCVSERLCGATFSSFLRSVSVKALVDGLRCSCREIQSEVKFVRSGASQMLKEDKRIVKEIKC